MNISSYRGVAPDFYDRLLERCLALSSLDDRSIRALVAELVEGWFGEHRHTARPLFARLTVEIEALVDQLKYLRTA